MSAPRTLPIDATLLGDDAIEQALHDLAESLHLHVDSDGIEWDLPPTVLHATGLAGEVSDGDGGTWSWDAPASYTVTHRRPVWDGPGRAAIPYEITLRALLDVAHDPRADGVARYDVVEA